MSTEKRFVTAMRAATPPERDIAFVVAVLERAERRRFAASGARAMLRGASVAACIAGLAVPVLTFAPPSVLFEGFAASAGLAATIHFLRRAAPRA